MSNEPTIPTTARCLRCGYLLRGLPTPVCPECGRAFNPDDASTYDLRPPGWGRRRWIIGGGAVALILVVFGPRGVLTGKLTFTCSACGDRTAFYRLEPRPPKWIHSRYPGIQWSAYSPAPAAAQTTTCLHPELKVDVRFDFRVGRATASGKFKQGKLFTFNGFETTVSTAPQVLEHLMDPLNRGIGP